MTEGREQREAVAAFKRAAAFLTNPISGLFAVALLPDPLDALSPDLSVLTFQPLNVLPADAVPVVSPSGGTGDATSKRSWSLGEAAEQASRNPITEPSNSPLPREANPVFPVARHREGERASRDGEATRSGSSPNQPPQQNLTSDGRLTPVLPNTNGSQGQYTTLTARELLSRPGNTPIPEPAQRQPSGTNLPQTQGQSDVTPLSAQRQGESASTAAGQPTDALQRTIEFIDVLVGGILAPPSAGSTGTARNTALITATGSEGNAGTPASVSPSSVGNPAKASDAILPPLTSLARPPMNLPDVPTSPRAPNFFPQTDPLGMDAEALSDMINQALVEQARRYGVDFS